MTTIKQRLARLEAQRGGERPFLIVREVAAGYQDAHGRVWSRAELEAAKGFDVVTIIYADGADVPNVGADYVVCLPDNGRDG